MSHPPKSCAICDVEFRPWSKDQRCCSRPCGQRLRFMDAPRSRKGRTCEVCEQAYDATYDGQRTCGRECGGVLNYRERPKVSLKRRRPKYSGPGPTCRVWFRDCMQCGRVFAARSTRFKLCSSECRSERNMALDPRRKPLGERSCRCGAPLPALNRVICDACALEARREQRRRRKRRRRARERGAISEPYTLAEVAARDRNVCQLCRKRVAMTKQVPHPRSPVIDHVLPLACDGDDTKANVQLAHFLCNSIKSAGGSQQLALIG